MVLLALVLLNLPTGVTTRLKLALGSVFLPLFGLASSSQQMTEKLSDAVLPRSVLVDQYRQLRVENQELRLRVQHGEEALRENERLRRLLAWQPRSPWKVRLARVVLREPANWWRSVEIDLGSRDGVVSDSPVLTPEGLVGRIGAVSMTRSQVLLVGDPNCRVSALIENGRRDLGILGVSSPLLEGLVELNYLPHSVEVQPGQNVVTSGLGGVYPKGIPIGKVVDVRAVDYGLYSQARVKLAANLSGIEEVWVLMP